MCFEHVLVVILVGISRYVRLLFQLQSRLGWYKVQYTNKRLLKLTTWSYFFVNSRTAIAGAIIGLLLVFYMLKNLNCIGALSFFKICSHIFEVKLV